MNRERTARSRIRFTVAELDLILSMMAIADAALWGEGDYDDWDEKTGPVYNSLEWKTAELRRRLKAKGGDGVDVQV